MNWPTQKFDAWTMPDGEVHLREWMVKRAHRVEGRLTYQRHKYEAALQFCKQRRLAVDVGAHIGLMSYWLARDFQSLHAFEPMPQLAECWRENVKAANALLYQFALGKENGAVRLAYNPADTGGTHIVSGVAGEPAEVRTLDEFDLQDVDFIKLDCEGAELAALEGAVETLHRCRPAVMVEQKPHIMAANFGTKGTPAVDFLIALGAKQRGCISGDYFLSFD